MTPATSPPTCRTAPRPRWTSRPRHWPRRSRACSPSSRVSRAATRRCARAPPSPWTVSARPFDGKYTVTTSRHRLDPAHRLHDGVLGHRRPGPHHAGPGRRRRTGHDRSSGRRRRHGRRRQRPGEARPGAAALPVARRHLRERLGAHGAGRGRRRTGERWCCPRWATRCWSSSSRATSGGPYVLGGLYNGIDQPGAQGIPVVDGGHGHGQPALDRLAPRPPDRPARRRRQDRGHHPRQRRRQGQPAAGRDRDQA